MDVKYVGLPFDGNWWDNASNQESKPLSTSEIDVWINTVDLQMASNVWHLYRLNGGRFKNMTNWMKSTFFFCNATNAQLSLIESKINQLIFVP